MVKRVKTAPRKQPRQVRAQETVDVVLAATARLIVSEGYDKMSTNRIAAAAGVSIGSLYQYFPSKEAIVAALVERHAQTMGGTSMTKIAETRDQPLDVMVRTVVQAVVDAKAVNPKLHRALREQVPRVGKLKLVDEVHTGIIAAVAGYLETQKSSLKIRDAELSAFLVVKAIDAVLHDLDDPRVTRQSQGLIIDEMVRMVVSYLRG